MGAVYIAHQLSTGRERALKLMHASLAGDENLRRRFEQEARIGSRIKSSHVVEVIAAGVEDKSGMPWLAMELLEGEDLAAHVGRRGALPVGEVERILSELCHALAAAHAVNVVHRDLKPENVFLARSHQQGAQTIVKLLDLGIAKTVAEAQLKDTAAVGTPLWMAPEQTGGTVTPRTDVWALGLLAFWMLTGRCYWRGASAGEGAIMTVLREVVVDPLEPASRRAVSLQCDARLPAGFDDWFSRCVARDPSDRFADAAEARQGFQRLLAGTADTVLALPPIAQGSASGEISSTAAASTLPQGAPQTPGRRWLGVGLALLAVGAGGLVLSRAQKATPSAPKPVAAAASHSSAVASASAAPVAVQRAPADMSDPNIVWRIPIGDSPQRGAADAPVTIVEFANFQCPFSKGVEAPLQKLLNDYQGKVRLVWKDDPLAVHSQAELSASVAREARAQKGEQGFWAAHDLFLDRAFKPSIKTLLEAAKKLELDLPKVERAVADRSYAELITADADVADDFGLHETPTFFVNGRRVAATPTLDKLRAAIDAELARLQPLLAQGTPPDKIYERVMQQARGGVPLEIKAFAVSTVASPSRGAPKSAVTLIQFCEFENFLCKLVDPTVDELLQKFPDELGAIWVDVPNPASEPSRRASLAARAAYRHGGVEGFDRMRRLLLEAQRKPDAFSNWALLQYADAIHLPRGDFKAGLEDPALIGEVEGDAQKVRQLGLAAELPAFLVCGPDFCSSGGYLLSGGQPKRAFEKRVRLVLSANGGALPLTPP